MVYIKNWSFFSSLAAWYIYSDKFDQAYLFDYLTMDPDKRRAVFTSYMSKLL
jgi:hypothetical protein